MLQCDYLNRATWNKVNQSKRPLRTKEGDLFCKQTSNFGECKQLFYNKIMKHNKVAACSQTSQETL